MISWLVVLSYLLILFVVSFKARKKIKSSDDFLLAGRSVGPFMLAATLAATHFGGGFVLGEAAWGVQYGLGGIWYGLACAVGLLCLSFVAKKLRSLEVYTAPQYLEQRYQSPFLRLLATVLSLSALIGILAAQIWASSGILEVLGLDANISAIVVTGFFIAYTAFSGLWAAILTDIYQIILATVGIVVATVMAWSKIGSLSSLRNKLDLLFNNNIIEQSSSFYFNLNSPGLSLIGLTVFATVLYTLIGQDFYQRLFAAKNEKVSKQGSIMAAVFLALLSLIPALLGLLALVISNDPSAIVSSPKTAIPALMLDLMGPILGAIFISAILAAIMSTADSLLSSAASHVSKDLYERYIVKDKVSDKKLLKVSISTTILVGVLALLGSFMFKDVISLLINAYDLYTGAIFVPLIGGILWKRANRNAAIASTLSGLSIVLLKVSNIVQFESSNMSFLWAVLVSSLIFVFVSIVSESK